MSELILILTGLKPVSKVAQLNLHEFLNQLMTVLWCYLSESFITFLVPAVEVLSGVEDKGLSCFYMSKLAICGKKKSGKEKE